MAKKRKKKERTFGRRDRTGTSTASSAGPAGAKADGDGERAGEGRRGGALAEWGKSIAIAVVLFVVLRTFVLQTFVITSGSMENTLLVNDYLLVNRLAYGARIPFTRKHLPGYSEPRRGDVVVFDPHHDPELKLVKRLIGMPGDTLWMRGGTLYINGEEQVEPYVLHREPETDAWSDWFVWQRDALVDTVDASTYRPTRDNWGPLVVPEGHYFMLGDNRDQSLDSRYWGPLATWRVEGRASLIYYSWDDRSVRPLPALTAIRTERIFRRIR